MSSSKHTLNKQLKDGVKQLLTPIVPWVYRRKFQAYCVGTAKSGTHSIWGLFAKSYRSAHEPETPLLLRVILDSVNGSINEPQKTELIKVRDRRLWLEMDSSVLNFFFMGILVREFPQAKFIMAIRDCYSWLDSIINHQLAYPARGNWIKLRELYYQTDKFKHSEEEKVLAERGLYTLDGYLSSWAARYRETLATIPKERLLVVKTNEITESVPRIAEFLNIPVHTLSPSSSHLFRAREKFHILSQLDPDFLREKADFYCKDLMDEYFPEVQNAKAVTS